MRQLLKSNGCDYRTGTARLVGPRTVELDDPKAKTTTVIEADNVVLATGSRPIEIPGFKFDGARVVDSTGALAFSEVPARLVVIGGGYIGIEIGTAFAEGFVQHRGHPYPRDDVLGSLSPVLRGEG